MLKLDTDTVIFSCSAISICVGCLLLLFLKSGRDVRIHWALAVLAYGVAGILIAFRAVLPTWLAIVLANGVIGVSVVLIHRGTWVLLGRRPPDALYAVSVIALTAAYVVFSYPEPQIGPRLFLVSAFRVPFFLSAAWALWPLRTGGRGARVLCWLLVAWAGWYALRAGLALSSGAMAVQVRVGGLQAINFLVATIGHLLIAAAQFRMEAERAVAEANRLARDLEDIVHARTAELQRAKEEAERANAAKSHFLAVASHDLRQPMQALRLFLDILNQRLAGTPNAEPASQAVGALASSEALLHALLDVSRLDAGTVTVSPAPVHLLELFGKLVAETAGLAAAKGVELRAVPCERTVISDGILLERAVRNLLVNAIRYTARGRVLIGCRRHGDGVRIEVWDSGPGIPADQLDRIFDDFYQVGNAGRDQAKGLGLGLAIVRRIAALLHARVSVRSRLGRGSVFAITVPARLDAAVSAVPASR